MASPVLIIPGLPDDLALLCLAWLPKRLDPLARCVSRAWRDAFHSDALVAIRHRLGIQENRLFLCLREDGRVSKATGPFTYSWWLLDPALCPQDDPLPSPPFPPGRCRDYDPMMGKGEVLLVAPLSYQGAVIASPFEEIRRLDVLRRRWRSPSPPNMLTCRTSFAPAYLDGHIYVAGGRAWGPIRDMHDYFEDMRRVRSLKSVERLECKTMSSWERLPDMQVARVGAKAVILNGCLCVIGGYDEGSNAIHSGEMWDVRSQMWVMVPEMWPSHIFSCAIGCPSNVASVMGTLFAIQHDFVWVTELMVYDAACKSWTSLGEIPYKSFHEDKVGLAYFHLFGVGKELWVMVEGNKGYKGIFIMACSPLNSTPSTLVWRLLPYSFHNLSFYRGLAVTM